MSIATERGDGGQTSLSGNVRVSKADLRVETYGTIDELISSMGFARAICANKQVHDFAKQIQRELFTVCSAISSRGEVSDDLVSGLTAEVHRIEALDGIIGDWTLPGEEPASAAFDVARTVCRRAERCAVRLQEIGVAVPANVLRYLNRLSDLLWLFSRVIELEQGIDARLRDKSDKGSRWSRAW